MLYVRLLLPLLSGLAISASFPGSSVYFLAWSGLIPFLYFCLTEKNRWILLIAHLVFSFAYFGGVLYWIPRVLVLYGGLNSFTAGILFLVMLSTLSLFLLPFTLLFHWTAYKGGAFFALLCAPGFWILTEIIRNYWAVSGFPWASLAYSQIPYQSIIQCTDIGGAYLLSFLIVLVNCALLALVWLQRIRFGAAILGVFLLFNLYGVYRISWWTVPTEGTVRVGLLQGCIDLAGTREYYAEKYYESLARLFDQATERGAAFVIIPEAQNPFFYSEDIYFRTFW